MKMVEKGLQTRFFFYMGTFKIPSDSFALHMINQVSKKISKYNLPQLLFYGVKTLRQYLVS